METIVKTLSMAAAVIIIQGCAPASYVVDNPTPSSVGYVVAEGAPARTITIHDKRAENQQVFSYGVLKAGLVQDGSEIDPVNYLKKHVQAEMLARAVNGTLADSDDAQVYINKLVMRNHRTNAYTPFITFTMLSADLHAQAKTERIAVYIKRGKVPVWSFDEIVQPTLNEPLDLLVKEFTAKLSSRLFSAQISDAEVEGLLAKIDSESDDEQSYRDVYQLGFGNNKSAVPALAELTRHESEYTRLAAISSLGILRAETQLELLQSIFNDSVGWQDRGMALKAMGDIGSPEAMAFLASARSELANMTEKEAAWNKEVIDLYLD